MLQIWCFFIRGELLEILTFQKSLNNSCYNLHKPEIFHYSQKEISRESSGIQSTYERYFDAHVAELLFFTCVLHFFDSTYKVI